MKLLIKCYQTLQKLNKLLLRLVLRLPEGHGLFSFFSLFLLCFFFSFLFPHFSPFSNRLIKVSRLSLFFPPYLFPDSLFFYFFPSSSPPPFPLSLFPPSASSSNRKCKTQKICQGLFSIILSFSIPFLKNSLFFNRKCLKGTENKKWPIWKS